MIDKLLWIGLAATGFAAPIQEPKEEEKPAREVRVFSLPDGQRGTIVLKQQGDEPAEGEGRVRLRIGDSIAPLMTLRELGAQAGAGGRAAARMPREAQVRTAQQLLERARAELEAGNGERAMEMIRAARAMLRDRVVRRDAIREAPIPARIRERLGALESLPGEGRIRVEVRRRTEGEGGEGQETVEVKEYTVKDGKIVESIPADEEAEDKEAMEEEKERAEEEEVAEVVANPVGVGLMLEQDDEGFVVRGLLPDSPAAREGSIQVDDRLLGVVDEDGEVFSFEGQPLQEVVGRIRGEVGTSVKLQVKSGDNEPQTIELERAALTPPSEGDDDAEADDADDEDDDEDADDDAEDDEDENGEEDDDAEAEEDEDDGLRQ